ncbi:hypothetical protein M0804_002921 [Polistes exclamans]|nr:hypothetical protein M0804_002921 [Polistes exclamans]
MLRIKERWKDTASRSSETGTVSRCLDGQAQRLRVTRGVAKQLSVLGLALWKKNAHSHRTISIPFRHPVGCKLGVGLRAFPLERNMKTFGMSRGALHSGASGRVCGIGSKSKSSPKGYGDIHADVQEKSFDGSSQNDKCIFNWQLDA